MYMLYYANLHHIGLEVFDSLRWLCGAHGIIWLNVSHYASLLVIKPPQFPISCMYYDLSVETYVCVCVYI